MNLSRGVQAVAGLGLVAYLYRAVAHAGDERNIRALARHLGCSREEARRLYVASRLDGYGAAQSRRGPGTRRSDTNVPVDDPRERVHR